MGRTRYNNYKKMNKSREVLFLLSFLLLILGVIPKAKALWLEIPNKATKCVSEDIRKSVVVLVDYYVIGDEEHVHNNVLPTVSVKVISPYGNNIHHQENVTHGQFGYTTSEEGTYMACFSTDGNPKGATVGIDWKTGIAAKDWESVAKKEKIEGLELELKKLEEVVEGIHENLVYLKSREAQMREVSEKTNARVAWFSIMSLGTCIVVSLVQVLHLKRYFRNKKLI